MSVIEHLPRDSYLAEAQAADEELARMIADQEIKPDKHPRISEWSGMRDDLAAIYDAVQVLTQTVVKVQTGKNPPKVKPYPRPVTAGQKLRSRGAAERNKARVAKLNALPRYGGE